MSDQETRRILIVEDHTLLRQALARIIGEVPGFTVVAQAGSVAEARDKMDSIDVAVVGFYLPDGNGTEIIRELSERNPHSRALCLAGSHDRTLFAQAVEAGAVAILHKSATLEEIIDTIKRVIDGETLFSVNELTEFMHFANLQRSRRLQAQRAAESLTPREREILQALADGLDDREIAQRLHVTVGTPRKHLANISRKLGVNSRLQALLFAIRHSLVELSMDSRRTD